MDLQLYAQIAEIIAAFSIFLTLVFLVIELKKICRKPNRLISQIVTW